MLSGSEAEPDRIGFAEQTWVAGGRVFAVIWGLWALLWVLFFLLLALGRDRPASFTGAVALGEMSANS